MQVFLCKLSMLLAVCIPLLGCAFAFAAEPATRPKPGSAHAMLRIISHGRALSHPATQPAGTTRICSYELGKFVQLDRDHVLLTASLREQGAQDFCVGNDGFVLSALDSIDPYRAVPINRPDVDYPLKSGDGVGIQGKFPGTAGIVPLGARLPDGSPHRAAGTGFYFSTAGTFLATRDRIHPKADWWLDFSQLSWNGKELKVRRDAPVASLFGHTLRNIGFRAIPRGPDFLFPVVATNGIVVLRLSYQEDRWMPVEAGKLIGTKNEFEPSILQDGDGFVMYTRGFDSRGRFYRSRDGLNFEPVFDRANRTVPQVLNKGLDGSLYLATNDSPGGIRNPLYLYAFKGQQFVDPMVLHDQNAAQDPQSVGEPFADHGIAANVLLGGKSRHLICYRVCDKRETDGHGAPPTPQTGLYLAEFEYANALPLPFGLSAH